MKAAIILTILLSLNLLAAPKRAWQTATLEETARSTVAAPAPRFGVAADPATAGALVAIPRLRVIQTYRIEGQGYSFTVSCDVTRGKTPNVTVHGAIKYALVDGTFYFLDDDGRGFKATVLEKARQP